MSSLASTGGFAEGEIVDASDLLNPVGVGWVGIAVLTGQKVVLTL